MYNDYCSSSNDTNFSSDLSNPANPLSPISLINPTSILSPLNPNGIYQINNQSSDAVSSKSNVPKSNENLSAADDSNSPIVGNLGCGLGSILIIGSVFCFFKTVTTTYESDGSHVNHETAWLLKAFGSFVLSIIFGMVGGCAGGFQGSKSISQTKPPSP